MVVKKKYNKNHTLYKSYIFYYSKKLKKLVDRLIKIYFFEYFTTYVKKRKKE